MPTRSMLLGVTGGVAAYKACELLRRLLDRGIDVEVIPTENALRFVGSATWEALSGKPVQSSLWENVFAGAHIESARNAQLILVAPTTADFIARIAQGRSDDLLSATVLTAQCPIIIIPAMHHQMWWNAATQSNVAILRQRGILVMEPAEGPLNNGDIGIGRFPEIFEIFDFLTEHKFLANDLLGKSVVITAGGTREMIDPVRYIGNLSSGKQGIALAMAAAARGARVHLIAANISPALLPKDKSISIVNVTSAAELAYELDQIEDFDALLMTAAVSDYRVVAPSSSKLKRNNQPLILELTQNPDLLSNFVIKHREQARPEKSTIIMGFAAESAIDAIEAAEKLARKGVDLLFVNDISHHEVFGSPSNGGLLIDKAGNECNYPYQSKDTLSDALLSEVVKALG